MSIGEAASIIVIIFLVLVIGNIVFSFLAERKNRQSAISCNFMKCDGIRLHYIERCDREAPCVVLFHGNGSLIQDFIISGLVDHLAGRYRVICFDSSRLRI